MPRKTLPKITQVNKKTTGRKAKEPRKTNFETSGYVRPERVNKWPLFSKTAE